MSTSKKHDKVLAVVGQVWSYGGVNRGMSAGEVARDFGWSTTTARKYLNMAVDYGMLSVETRGYTGITGKMHRYHSQVRDLKGCYDYPQVMSLMYGFRAEGYLKRNLFSASKYAAEKSIEFGSQWEDRVDALFDEQTKDAS